MRNRTALVVAGLLLPAVLSAQSRQRWAVQASALNASLSGDAYQSFPSGGGYELQLRYTVHGSAWSFGAGWQSTTHDSPGSTQHATLQGPFFEPRYTFLIPRNEWLFPYLSARFAELQQKVSDPSYGEASSSGTTGGVGGGVLIKLTSKLNIDLGATAGFTTFGDLTLNGTKLPGTPSGSGTNNVLRLGVAYGFK